MKREVFLVNMARGTLILENDLIAALDSADIGHAVLDVFQLEPLPQSSPLWHHPSITVTPHVSGWDLDDGVSVVSENYRRLTEDQALLHEINRELGYWDLTG